MIILSENKTLLDDFLGETFNKISHENLSLFAFIYTLYIARLGTGGEEGNYYDVKIYNKWFDVDFKVTIKTKMSLEQMEEFKNVFGFDIYKSISEFKDAGIIEEGVDLNFG